MKKRDYAKQSFLLTRKEMHIYVFITNNPDSTFRDLANEFDMPLASTQRVVNRLIQAGLIGPGKETVNRFKVL